MDVLRQTLPRIEARGVDALLSSSHLYRQQTPSINNEGEQGAYNSATIILLRADCKIITCIGCGADCTSFWCLRGCTSRYRRATSIRTNTFKDPRSSLVGSEKATATFLTLADFFLRRGFWLSNLQDMGVYIFPADSKHIPLLAYLRLAFDCPEMGLGRSWKWPCTAVNRVLLSTHFDVPAQLHSRRLGDT